VQSRLATAIDRLDRLVEELDRAVARLDAHAERRVVPDAETDPTRDTTPEPTREPTPPRAGWYWTLPASSAPPAPAGAGDLAETVPRP
jgi:hypothetical protein